MSARNAPHPSPLVLALVLALLAAGCAAPAPAPPEEAHLRMLALDGRWTFDEARGAAFLARAGAPPHVGALLLGEAFGAARVADVGALDAAAARTLNVSELPAPGVAHVTRAWAERAQVAQGATLALRSHAWPVPYVATYFEMERTQTCERRPDAKLCFLPEAAPGTARLRLTADAGARDAGFLPDLVELGFTGRPAYWNGTFTSPEGEATPFTAIAPLEGRLIPGEFDGMMTEGHWTISFRLEANGTLQPSGAAGIVRIREPGHLWFDDRLQQNDDARAQARAVLANATPTSANVTVARIVDTLPLGLDVLLAREDAAALVGTPGVSALLVELTASGTRAIDAARGPDGMTLALRPRALPDAAPRSATTGDLVFAAPADIDLASLPPVPGAGAPLLALAGREPVGEALRLDGVPIVGRPLVLAPAAGELPFAMPPQARWSSAEDALENLSRSRTLALASPDLDLPGIATARVEISTGNTTRSLVAVGGVVGGPHATLWTSAALVAGAGAPVAPRIVLPVLPGEDRAEVAQDAMAAWEGRGVTWDG